MSWWRSTTPHPKPSAGTRLVEQVVHDARFAFRSLRKQPGLTAAVLLTLTLGIGANVAMFSVANLTLFRALPYPDAERLVVARTQWPGGGIGWTVSAPDFYDVRDEAASFGSLAGITPFTRDVTLTGPGGPLRVSRGWASPGFFGTLGVAPLLGRGFLPSEGEPGGEPVVILSYELWQSRLGGDPDVIGSTLTLDGMPRTVVGVMPAAFEFVTETALWMPMVRGQGFAGARQFHNWLVVGRLRSGVTLATAQSEADVIMRRLAETYPESNRDKGLVVSGLQSAMFEDFRPTLLMLAGAIALVLLIACANVASLLLARASSRRGELAMRSALGAGGGRLVRQLLTESAMLGLGAGALGTLAALGVQRSLVAVTPLARLGLETSGIQPEVLLFALGLSLATVVVFGLAPAVAAARVQPATELKSGSRSVTGGRRAGFRHGLVVGQVALSVVLLVGAGLLLRSFLQLRGVDPGFRSENLVTAEIGLPRAGYEERERRVQFFAQILERVRAIPGVRHAALIDQLPIRDPGGNVAAWDAERPPADASEARLAYARVVMPDYFEAMGIPLRAGRDVEATDVESAPPVIVINETMARTLFGETNPLGRRVGVDQGDGTGHYDVVGVVGDVQVSDLAADLDMVMYFAYPQWPSLTMRLAVRTAAEPGSVVGPIRAALAELDSRVPLAGVATMEEVLGRSVSFSRTVTSALGLFAGVALFLAALGLYGVLAYYVAQRTREIGVRLALGATTRDVIRLVLSRGFTLVGLGLGIGIAVAAVASRLIQKLLFDVPAADPVTFGGVTVFFGLVAFVACLMPARRAVRVDPAVAFRAE